MKKHQKILGGLLVAMMLAVTAYGQTTANVLVSMYSLVNSTWETFTATTITATTLTAGTLNATTIAISGGSGGTTLAGITSTNVSVDFGACGTNATVTVTKTIAGIDTNDVAVVNIVAPHTSFVYNCSVTGADTVTLRASNISITNAINLDPTDARITVFKY